MTHAAKTVEAGTSPLHHEDIAIRQRGAGGESVSGSPVTESPNSPKVSMFGIAAFEIR